MASKCLKASDANRAADLVNALDGLKRLRKKLGAAKPPTHVPFGQYTVSWLGTMENVGAFAYLDRRVALKVIPLVEKVIRDELSKIGVCA